MEYSINDGIRTEGCSSILQDPHKFYEPLIASYKDTEKLLKGMRIKTLERKLQGIKQAEGDLSFINSMLAEVTEVRRELESRLYKRVNYKDELMKVTLTTSQYKLMKEYIDLMDISKLAEQKNKRKCDLKESIDTCIKKLREAKEDITTVFSRQQREIYLLDQDKWSDEEIINRLGTTKESLRKQRKKIDKILECTRVKRNKKSVNLNTLEVRLLTKLLGKEEKEVLEKFLEVKDATRVAKEIGIEEQEALNILNKAIKQITLKQTA